MTYGSGDHGTPGARNNAYSGHISASDYAFDFGGIVEGNETSNTVYIYNTGLRSLVVDSMDNVLGDFVISPTSGNIPVGDSLQLLLRFVPIWMMKTLSQVTIGVTAIALPKEPKLIA